MSRRLTVTLAIALLMFVLAPMASADEITTPSGILIIPDGSQVTSVFVLPPDTFDFGPAFGVDFSFQGGTGSTYGTINEGDVGSITFTVPVTDLSFTAIVDGNYGQLSADGFGYSCYNPAVPNHSLCGTPFDETVSGPVSEITWNNFKGFSGVESLSFTVDAGDPPTSSLILLGFGLIGLLALSHCKGWFKSMRLGKD
jgi:hypothetical protein